MRFLLSRQQVRLLIGELMLLSIQGLVMPRPAWAGCSNLVHSHAQNHGALVNLDALITGWTATERGGDPVVDLSTRHKPSRRLPCSGPSCTGRVPLPASATGVGAVDPVQWGVLPNSFELVPSPGRKEWADESLADLTGHPSLVFHPPRDAIRIWASPASVIVGFVAYSRVESHTPCWFLGSRLPLAKPLLSIR